MPKKNRTLRVTRLKLSDFAPNQKDAGLIEASYTEFEVARQIATKKHREAAQAQATAQQAILEMQRLHQALLLKVGEMSTEVASEPVWYVFRKNGDLMFESPYGERTQRNLIRAQLQLLEQQVNDGEKDPDLYEEEGDEDNGTSGAASA
jgi:hypothetical protein